MRKTIIPRYVLENMQLQDSRAYRARKRMELKTVMKAFSTFRRGSAFAPGFHAVNEITRQLDILADALRVKNWDRAKKAQP